MSEAPAPQPRVELSAIVGAAAPRRLAFALSGAVLLALLIVFTARTLLVLFGGFLFAVVLRGIAAALARHTRVPYGACLALIVATLVSGVVTLVVLAGPALYDQLVELANSLPAAARDVLAHLRRAPLGRALTPPLPSGPANATTVVLAFTQSPSLALVVLVVYTVLHVFEGYVLAPLLARVTVRFPPALTLAGQVGSRRSSARSASRSRRPSWS